MPMMAASKSKSESKKTDEQPASTLSDDHLSLFSRTLRHILQQDRLETSRLAQTLQVTENTIYRWLNGRSDPRPANLRALLDALPEHRSELGKAIRQTFPGMLDEPLEQKRELSKGVYRQILKAIAELSIDQGQLRLLVQQLFNDIAQILDPQMRGLVLTYATVMPPQADGYIHTLREVFTCGSHPWPAHYDDRVFLGRTTLAGNAVMDMRSYTWHDLDEERVLVEVDDHERSACACPVTRFGQIGGVLVISSTIPELFNEAESCSIVEEAAHLLAMTLRESDLYASSLLRLAPMPSLGWQRKRINSILVERTNACMRAFGLSLHDAELRVAQEMEREFEEEGRLQIKQHQVSSSA